MKMKATETNRREPGIHATALPTPDSHPTPIFAFFAMLPVKILVRREDFTGSRLCGGGGQAAAASPFQRPPKVPGGIRLDTLRLVPPCPHSTTVLWLRLRRSVFFAAKCLGLKVFSWLQKTTLAAPVSHPVAARPAWWQPVAHKKLPTHPWYLLTWRTWRFNVPSIRCTRLHPRPLWARLQQPSAIKACRDGRGKGVHDLE